MKLWIKNLKVSAEMLKVTKYKKSLELFCSINIWALIPFFLKWKEVQKTSNQNNERSSLVTTLPAWGGGSFYQISFFSLRCFLRRSLLSVFSIFFEGRCYWGKNKNKPNLDLHREEEIGAFVHQVICTQVLMQVI